MNYRLVETEKSKYKGYGYRGSGESGLFCNHRFYPYAWHLVSTQQVFVQLMNKSLNLGWKRSWGPNLTSEIMRFHRLEGKGTQDSLRYLRTSQMILTSLIINQRTTTTL